MQWLRKAAENGLTDSSLQLAGGMYMNQPYAREVGRVGEPPAARVTTSAWGRGSHSSTF